MMLKIKFFFFIERMIMITFYIEFNIIVDMQLFIKIFKIFLRSSKFIILKLV